MNSSANELLAPVYQLKTRYLANVVALSVKIKHTKLEEAKRLKLKKKRKKLRIKIETLLDLIDHLKEKKECQQKTTLYYF